MSISPIGVPLNTPTFHSLTVAPPLSADQRISNFWGLGPLWWKQIIDGESHEWGPYVFDENLNGAGQEPAFLKTIQEACEYACANFDQPLTPLFYKQLHIKACAGFQGGETFNFELRADQAGRFRATDFFPKVGARFDYRRFFESTPTNKIADKLSPKLLELNKLTYKRISNNHYPISLINSFMYKGSSFPYAVMQYTAQFKVPLDTSIKEMFDSFNQKMEGALTNEEKLHHIAAIYQDLEWIHPFPDGQGRVDIVLLNWLLCKYGFNPAILVDPYMSSVSTLGNWIQTLKDGMESWRQERERVYFC